METNSDVNVLDEKISVLSQYVREYNDHSNCDIHVCDNSSVLLDDRSVPTFPSELTEAEIPHVSLMSGHSHVCIASDVEQSDELYPT